MSAQRAILYSMYSTQPTENCIWWIEEEMCVVQFNLIIANKRSPSTKNETNDRKWVWVEIHRPTNENTMYYWTWNENRKTDERNEGWKKGWIEKSYWIHKAQILYFTILLRLLSEMDGQKGFICVWLMKTNVCIAM